MTDVVLPQNLRAQILDEARAAGPRECCGLLEGTREGGIFRVLALHAMANTARDCDRFEMNPADQIAAQKAARVNGHAIIGCYHSHPNGHAEPSAADQAGAGEENFLWLIAGHDRLNAFVYAAGCFARLDWALPQA